MIATIYYVIRWIRDGATIAPLSDREIKRIRKKKIFADNTDRESRIEALDKSRHLYRVSDSHYDGDEVYGDLNYNIADSFERYEDKVEAEMENQKSFDEAEQDDEDDMPEDL